jgi:exodeoxyribonuclease VII small subunit
VAKSGGGQSAETGGTPGTDGSTTERSTTDRPAKERPPAARPATERPPPYEKARDELTDLVKRLEAGGLTLEQSLELWERGEKLAAICEDWLEGARARLATAMSQRTEAGGTPGTPF